MYKHKFFENRAELLAWLNENHITPDNIIEILPMPTSGNSRFHPVRAGCHRPGHFQGP